MTDTCHQDHQPPSPTLPNHHSELTWALGMVSPVAFVAALALVCCVACVGCGRSTSGDGPDSAESRAAIAQAFMAGDTTQVKELLDQGVELPGFLRLPSRKLVSVAEWVVVKGSSEMLELVLGAGVRFDSNKQLSLEPSLVSELSDGREVHDRGEEREGPAMVRVRLLHVAAMRQDPELVEVLLAYGADPNGRSYSFETPLHTAVKYPNSDCIALLIEAGADVGAMSSSGHTPLHFAAAGRNPAAVTLLLQAGADPATKDRFGQKPQDMADQQCRSILDEAERAIREGESPLIQALQRNNYAALQTLLAGPVDVDVADRSGITPLHIAVRNVPSHEIWVVERIVHAGANVNAKAKDGQSPLHCAAMSTDARITAILIQAEADVNSRDSFGRTPLHIAAWYGNDDVIGRLLDAGADARAVDDEKSGAFHYAAMAPDEYAVALLLDAGVDAKSQNRYGSTPLHVAVARSNLGAVSALLQAGLDVNAMDRSGNRPLHIAAQLPDTQMLLALLDAGADPSARNEQGAKPYDVARAEHRWRLRRAEREAKRAAIEDASLPGTGR